MSSGSAKFRLWYPQYELNEGSTECTFDVSPVDDHLIYHGDQKLINHFTEVLSLPGPVKTWTITPFSTSYYAEDPSSAIMSERFSPSWRVKITAHGVMEETPPPGPGAILAHRYDPTWWEHRLPWNWNSHEFSIIAISNTQTRNNFPEQSRFNYTLEEIPIDLQLSQLTQVRMNLQGIQVPRDMEIVTSISNAYRSQGCSIHFKDSYAYFLE